MNNAPLPRAYNSLIRAFVLDTLLFGDDGKTLSDDDSFIEKGIIDSTGILELIAFLEERFEIPIDDQDVVPENMDSVNRIASFVARKHAGGEKPRERGDSAHAG